MRLAFLLAAILASAAQAGTIIEVVNVASTSNTHTHAMAGVTTIDGWVQLAGLGGYRWTLTGLTQDDVGQVFTLDEAGASLIGFPWLDADIFIKMSSGTFFTLGTGTTIDGEMDAAYSVRPGPYTRILPELIDLRLRLDSWESNHVRVTGSVRYLVGIPEPTNFALCGVTFCGLLMRRTRTG